MSDKETGTYRRILATGKINTIDKSGNCYINGHVKKENSHDVFYINGFRFDDLSEFDIREDFRKINE